MPMHEASAQVLRTFDGIYLPRKLVKARHNVTKAAAAAGVDPKNLPQEVEGVRAGTFTWGRRRRLVIMPCRLIALVGVPEQGTL